MITLSYRIISYFTPAILALAITRIVFAGQTMKSILVIHCFLLISLILSTYILWSHNFHFWVISWNIFAALYLCSVLFWYIYLGKTWVAYSISVLLQELTILLTAMILLFSFPIYIVYLLIIPLFIISHDSVSKYKLLRILILSFWWGATLYLFSLTQNIWLSILIHNLLWIILIKQKVFLQYMETRHE